MVQIGLSKPGLAVTALLSSRMNPEPVSPGRAGSIEERSGTKKAEEAAILVGVVVGRSVAVGITVGVRVGHRVGVGRAGVAEGAGLVKW